MMKCVKGSVGYWVYNRLAIDYGYDGETSICNSDG